MLHKSQRLKRTEDIEKVFRRGRGFFSPFLSVKYSFPETSGPTRLAFSFGKKQLPRAVDRNRLKRLIIGHIKNVPDFFLLGIDVVFFLQKPIDFRSQTAQKELKQSIESFLKAVYTKGKSQQ